MKVKDLILKLQEFDGEDEILCFKLDGWGPNPTESPESHRDLRVCDERKTLGYLSIVPQADKDKDGWAGCA